MASQQGTLPRVRQGGVPAQVNSNDQVDAVSHSSSVESSANLQNGKVKKKGKFKQFFNSLGRKSKTVGDSKATAEEKKGAKPNGGSKIRHSQSQSIPKSKDTTFGVPAFVESLSPLTPSIIVKPTNELQPLQLPNSTSTIDNSEPVQRDAIRNEIAAVPRATNGETLPHDSGNSVQRRSPQVQDSESTMNLSDAQEAKRQVLTAVAQNYTISADSDRPNAKGSATNQLPVSMVGMVNHGNSCFMNAVIQCLRHTNTLARYFAMATYRESQRFGTTSHGSQASRMLELSDAFASLVSALWRADYMPSDSLKLRKLAGRHCSQYDSAMQQDAQEFLLWLLDALDDELRPALGSQRRSEINGCAQKELSNGVRIDCDVTQNGSEREGDFDDVKRQKRVSTNLQMIEQFQRNGSELWRHVAGFYESTLVCPVCSKTSVTYEPFTCLSLPLTQRHVYMIDVAFSRALTHVVGTPGSVTAKYDVPVWQVRVACPVNTMENVRFLKKYLIAQRVLRLSEDQRLLLVDIPSTLNLIKSLSDSTKLGDLEHIHFHAFVLDTPPTGPTPHSNSSANLVEQNSTTMSNGAAGAEPEAWIALVVLNVERYFDSSRGSEAFIRQFARPFVLTRVSRTISYWQLLANVVQTMLYMRESRASFARPRIITPDNLSRDLKDFRANASLYAIDDETDEWVPINSSLDMPLLSEVTDRLIASTTSNTSSTGDVAHLKVVIEWNSEARIGFFNQLSSSYSVPALSADEELSLGVLEDVTVSDLLPARANTTMAKQTGLVGAASLTECLKMNFREELLGSDDAWMCPQCKCLQAGSTKKLSLCSLADLFIVHLKRFRQTDGKRAKIDCLVDFPLDGLDMSTFCTDRYAHVRTSDLDSALRERVPNRISTGNSAKNAAAAALNGKFLNAVKFDSESESESATSEYENIDLNDVERAKHSQAGQFSNRKKDVRLRERSSARMRQKDVNENNMTYDLVAVVNHYGTLQSGHYTAFCRYPQNGVGNIEASGDLWLSYDDQVVTRKRPSEVCTPAAYLLFYQRRGAATERSGEVHWSTLLPPRESFPEQLNTAVNSCENSELQIESDKVKRVINCVNLDTISSSSVAPLASNSQAESQTLATRISSKPIAAAVNGAAKVNSTVSNEQSLTSETASLSARQTRVAVNSSPNSGILPSTETNLASLQAANAVKSNTVQAKSGTNGHTKPENIHLSSELALNDGASKSESLQATGLAVLAAEPKPTQPASRTVGVARLTIGATTQKPASDNSSTNVAHQPAKVRVNTVHVSTAVVKPVTPDLAQSMANGSKSSWM